MWSLPKISSGFNVIKTRIKVSLKLVSRTSHTAWVYLAFSKVPNGFNPNIKGIPLLASLVLGDSRVI